MLRNSWRSVRRLLERSSNTLHGSGRSPGYARTSRTKRHDPIQGPRDRIPERSSEPRLRLEPHRKYGVLVRDLDKPLKSTRTDNQYCYAAGLMALGCDDLYAETASFASRFAVEMPCPCWSGTEAPSRVDRNAPSPCGSRRQ